MNNLRALLATVLLGLMMLGCATPVIAQTHMDNPKFIRQSEPVLGLNQEELTEVLGKPKNVVEAGCAVPLQLAPDRPPIPVFGNAWFYEYQTDEMRMSTIICVVDKHAVAEEQKMGFREGTRIHTRHRSSMDTDLVEKAFRGELDGMSQEERTTPPYDGPEYEI